MHSLLVAMNHIWGDRLSQPWWVQGAILGAALLTLGVSFCLFDGDHGVGGGHLLSPDLCVGLLASPSLALLVVPLPLSGWALMDRRVSIPVSTLHVPAPPPKLL